MIYEAINSNKRKTVFLIALFIVFISALFYFIGTITKGGVFLVPIGVIIAIATSWGSYYYSDRIVLSISKAKPLEHKEFPYLDNTIEGIAIAGGLPKPKAYIIEDDAPNAFATGRDPGHSIICFTTGLLKKLNRGELEGVISHEMSHIGNFDIRLMAIVATLVGMVVIIGHLFWRVLLFGGMDLGDGEERGPLVAVMIVGGLILMILAPIFASMMQLAISRKREYLADAAGAMLSRNPRGLADALRKLSQDSNQLKVANNATAHMYIVNPFKKGAINKLFNTHPPIEERIRRLEEM